MQATDAPRDANGLDQSLRMRDCQEPQSKERERERERYAGERRKKRGRWIRRRGKRSKKKIATKIPMLQNNYYEIIN